MTYRFHRTLLFSLSAAAMLLTATGTFARSGPAPARGVVVAPSTVRSGLGPAARSVHGPAARFHRRNAWAYWPGNGGYYYGPSVSEPYAPAAPEAPEAAQPPSNDVHYTYTNDVPWDWAHRFPPNVVPSDRPYVPGCPSETVVVPGKQGERTVNIIRCY